MEGAEGNILDVKRLDRELNKHLITISNMRLRHRYAIADWIENMGEKWDIACCWHVPEAMRMPQNEHGAESLSKQLAVYFNKMRKRTFSHLPRSQRPVLPRFITLEWTDGVGWHAHGLISTPSHLTIEQMMEITQDEWMGHVGRFASGRFSKRLVWTEPREGRYASYIAKQSMQLPNYNWDGGKGFIDLNNTARS
jgi:hypothetical protein